MKIRSDIVRTYQAVHSWTGITAGLLLFICFFAGALTMFQHSIQRWADVGWQQDIMDWPIPTPTELDNLIQQVVSEDKAAAKKFVLSLDESQTLMSWNMQRPELGSLTERRFASIRDGELLTHQVAQNQLSKLLDELHRTAGIAGKVGRDHIGIYIMGVAGGVYFLALISGFIFLLPTLARSFFALRENKGRFRFLLDTHNLVGITSLPFHIIIAFTVVVFAFHDQFYQGVGLIYGDKTLFERQQPDAEIYPVQQLASIEEFVALAQRELPDYQLNSITFRNLGTPTPLAIMNLKDNSRMMVNPAGDRLVVHPFTLEVTYNTSPTGDEGIWGRLVSSFFALHFGSYGGEWTRWLYFFLGLGGAYLFYSGNLLWLEKRRQQKNYSPKILRNMTALTLGVCYGCIAAIASAMLIGRWLSEIVENLNALYVACYYLVFIGCIVFAFLRQADKALLELKWLCALLCLLMPLTSLLAWLVPLTALPLSHTLETYLLELVALLFALLFWRSATIR